MKNHLAISYNNLDNYRKTQELQKKVYDLSCKVLGKSTQIP